MNDLLKKYYQIFADLVTFTEEIHNRGLHYYYYYFFHFYSQ